MLFRSLHRADIIGGEEVAVDGLGVDRGAAGFSRTIDEQAGQRRRVADGAVRISFEDRLYQAGANALVAEWHRGQALHRHRLVHRLRSEEHTSELQSLMRISYAVFSLTKKNK